MKGVVLIGSKPFQNIDLTPVIDSIETVIRCNVSVPGHNNGTRIGEQHLNCHVHDQLITRRFTEDQFVAKNAHHTRKEAGREFYRHFKANRSKFSTIIRDTLPLAQCNAALKRVGCPLRLTKQPRIGYSALYRNLGQRKVFVFGFSLFDDDPAKVSYYNVEGKQPNIKGHEHDREREVLRWLHVNRPDCVDATLCMIRDCQPLTFDDGLQPSAEVLDMLKVCGLLGADPVEPLSPETDIL